MTWGPLKAVCCLHESIFLGLVMMCLCRPKTVMCLHTTCRQIIETKRQNICMHENFANWIPSRNLRNFHAFTVVVFLWFHKKIRLTTCNFCTCRIKPTLAFAAQRPWIQNATLRDNILCGLPMDTKRYVVKLVHLPSSRQGSAYLSARVGLFVLNSTLQVCMLFRWVLRLNSLSESFGTSRT